MQIAPINNTNFNGRFKKTPELEKLLKYADHNSLGRFNEVLGRAEKINDKKIYKITSLSDFEQNSWGKTSVFHFHLLSYPENYELSTAMENMWSFEHYHWSGKEKLLENFAQVLKSFISTLEKIYPKTDFESSTKELIESINQKLI